MPERCGGAWGGLYLYYAGAPDAIRRISFLPCAIFKYSIVYLMALFAFLLADHWLVGPMIGHDLLLQPAA